MAKTTLTKSIEHALWVKTNGLMYGCREVKIGLGSNRHLLTNREEYVDYMTITASGEITCYEIKVSKSDFKSNAALSFEGHRNYMVLPNTLYDEIKDTDYYFTLKIEINTDELCLCFGFDSKKKGEELSFVRLEDMKNISKDFYSNLTELETNLGQNDVESRNGKKAIDMSLENTNFRKVSTDNKFLMNLLEDKTREEEVKRVYEEIDNILKKAGLK